MNAREIEREGETLHTLGGMSRARSGMWRSPITRMRKAMMAGYRNAIPEV